MHNALPFANKGLTRAAICIAGYSAATQLNKTNYSRFCRVFAAVSHNLTITA
jgi:hypothetical protein